MRRPRYPGKTQPSAMDAKAQFARVITNAPNLDALPPLSSLAHMYRVPIKDAEYALVIERQRRERNSAA